MLRLERNHQNIFKKQCKTSQAMLHDLTLHEIYLMLRINNCISHIKVMHNSKLNHTLLFCLEVTPPSPRSPGNE